MFDKSKKLLVVITLVILAFSSLAFAPYNPAATPSPDGQGVPMGQSGHGMGALNGKGGYSKGVGMSGSAGQYCNGVCTSSAAPLSDAEVKALQRAILEEYRALNLYQAIIEQFGNVLPFSRIVRSEKQHVTALLRQAEKYGVDAPANPGLTSPVTFSTLTEAYQAGIEAEKADAALYDELKSVTNHSDLLAVYTRLQYISLNVHLPAFEAHN